MRYYSIELREPFEGEMLQTKGLYSPNYRDIRETLEEYLSTNMTNKEIIITTRNDLL